MTDELVTKKDAAKHFRVSTQALDAWFSAGCPVAERDENGSIKGLSLPAMQRWKRHRDTRQKMTPDIRERMDLDFRFVCEIVIPGMAERAISKMSAVAKLAGVSPDDTLQVWAALTQLSFWSVADLFGKNEDEVEFHFPDSVCAVMKEIGKKNRASQQET